MLGKGRKHSIHYEEDDLTGKSISSPKKKKVKLEKLFGQLHLNEADSSDIPDSFDDYTYSQNNCSVHPRDTFIVNPAAISKGNMLDNNHWKSFDTYFNDKIVSNLNNMYESMGKIIHWYSRSYIISFHFQRWALRLFNRFVSRRQGGVSKKKKFNAFYKIIELIESNPNLFSFFELRKILAHESTLELKELSRKYLNDKSKKSHIEELKDEDHLGYYYWDTIQNACNDIQMGDETSYLESTLNNPASKTKREYDIYAPNSANEVEIQQKMDIDSDIRIPSKLMTESDYGSYYNSFHSP